MSTIFLVKGIKPAKLNIDAYRLEILNQLRAEGRVQKKELDKTTRTWKGEKPKFETLVGLERPPGSASVLTGPSGSDKAVNKWVWLNGGTRIRWALMSKDWQSKTRPRWFGSGRGSGRVLIAGKRAMTRRGIAPRPGIEARGWSEDLQKRRKRPFTRGMVKAMQRASRKAF
jgi:hypothetical protein